VATGLAAAGAATGYLSRYTHRVAISNSRLIAADRNGVTFKYKDFATG
jgi:Putative transposase